MPSFHGLMVVRDEADIIAQTLKHLLGWIDDVFVLDLGSDDETWEIVLDFSRKDKRIVPLERNPYKFNESIRGYLFNRVRNKFREGDWVLRLDADEFYHISPRTFVSEFLRPFETCVYLGWYYFRLTAREVEDYESGQVDIFQDRKRPIEDRRHFYKIPHYAEPRMFRYRSTIKWSPKGSFPYHAGCIARARLPIRHYPHRDPLQMEARYQLRSAIMRLGADAGPHWALRDWRKDVLQIDPLTRAWIEPSDDVGLRTSAGHTTGELLEWRDGTELPPISGDFHLGPRVRRLRQRFMPPIIFPILDYFRPNWPRGTLPELVQQTEVY